MQEDLIKRIVKYRAKHKLSQTDFAKLAGVSTQTINSIENNTQSPTKVTVAKIEIILDEDDDTREE